MLLREKFGMCSAVPHTGRAAIMSPISWTGCAWPGPPTTFRPGEARMGACGAEGRELSEVPPVQKRLGKKRCRVWVGVGVVV